jgi:hypothetical protein
MNAGFVVLAVVAKKSFNFWDVKPYGLVKVN